MKNGPPSPRSSRRACHWLSTFRFTSQPATAVVAASSDVAPLAARSVSHSFRRLVSTPASTSPLAATVDQNAPGVGTGVEGVGIGLPPFRVSLRKS